MILSFELTRLGSRPQGCLTAEKLTQLYSYRRLICISFRGRFKNILNDYYSETTSFFLWEKTLIYCRWEQYKVYCHQSQLISVRHWNRHFWGVVYRHVPALTVKIEGPYQNVEAYLMNYIIILRSRG